uniref:Anaphase-promoting complex subunit 2 n=1 Tax=Phytophthora ramorum TaxID=164328 RepID=H3GLW2_PHYRM
MSGGLRVDRELLWRKLFAFDHQPAEDLSANAQDLSDRLCGVIQRAVHQGRQEPLRQMLLQRLGYWLRSDVAPPFWSFFDALPAEIQRSNKRSRRQLALLCAQQLTLALQFAEDAFAHCVQLASLFDEQQLKSGGMLQELRTSFRCIVLEDAERFEELLVIFFSMSFHRFRGLEQAQAFDARPIRQTLLQLQWLHVAEPALLRVLHSQVKKVVRATCGDAFDELFLAEVEHWACSELLPWLQETMQTNDHESVQKWRDTLSQHVLQEFGTLRIAQLFEIIKEFPDSIPALEDLRQCLERTQQHGQLVREFRAALQSRLLQPGANTAAILDIYVSTIKYLRKRKDTVRCIVQSLTDEQNGDLFEELRRDNMRIIQHDDDSDDDENLEFDTDRDVQTLELLKLRFGEDSLQQCEIMVRDIEDSKRLNLNVRSTMENPAAKAAAAAEARARRGTKSPLDCVGAPSTRVDATIISQQFWPPLQGEDFTLHPKVSKDIDAFKDSYHVLRNPRSLDWNPSLGSVQLSIDLEGEEREFTVSPLQATIILYFDEKDRWGVEELAGKLEISDDLLLKHISLWVNHGLVSFASGRKELVASSSFLNTRCDDNSMVEELETAVSSDAQAEEDLKVLETYIVGMLSNFGSLTIHRIHNMLSTFARSGAQPYTKTISGLSVVLGKLVDKGKLELVGGQYQLAR